MVVVVGVMSRTLEKLVRLFPAVVVCNKFNKDMSTWGNKEVVEAMDIGMTEIGDMFNKVVDFNMIGEEAAEALNIRDKSDQFAEK